MHRRARAVSSLGALALACAPTTPPIDDDGAQVDAVIAIDVTEVTVAEFEQLLRAVSVRAQKPSRIEIPPSAPWTTFSDNALCNIGSGRTDHPVNCVSWQAADIYC